MLKRNNYLNNFDDEAEGYGKGCQDDEKRDEGDEVGAQARSLFAAC